MDDLENTPRVNTLEYHENSEYVSIGVNPSLELETENIAYIKRPKLLFDGAVRLVKKAVRDKNDGLLKKPLKVRVIQQYRNFTGEELRQSLIITEAAMLHYSRLLLEEAIIPKENQQ